MNDTVTYYDILGINDDASQEDISRAYRALAKKMHPDVGGSAHAMQLLNRAYKTLSNPTLRTEYDASLNKRQEKEFYQEHNFHEPTPRDLIAEEKAAITTIKKAAGKGMMKGIGLLILGVVITAISYSSTSAGGHYWVLWGLVLWGGIAFFKSWYHFLNPYNSLHKVLDKPGEPYHFYLEKRAMHARALLTILGSCAAIVILFSMIGASGSSSNNNTQSASPSSTTGLSADQQSKLDAYNACKTEYDSSKSRLDTVNNEMNSYKASDNIDLYNSLVPEQNSLARQTNSKSTECEQLRQAYNSSL